MESKKNLHFAVIRDIVDRKGDIGKTKIQKIIYFLQNAFGVPLGYSFKMYYYGTYSEELDNELSDMHLQDYLRIEPDPAGYGYHIQPGEDNMNIPEDMVEPQRSQIEKCLKVFGGYDAKELELYSALHFVNRILNNPKKGDVVDRVAVLKPKFDKGEIEKAYDELGELVGLQMRY